MNLISDQDFELWKGERNLAENVLFGTKTSYIGLRLRSRPGAFYLTEKELVHWSYSPKDCELAILEKEIKIVIPIKEVSSIHIEKLPILWRIAFIGAKWVVKIKSSRETEAIILYEQPDHFAKAANDLGLVCV